MNKFLATAGATATGIASLGMVAVAAQPASAATVTRQCGPTVQMCLHYNSVENGSGAEFGTQSNISSLNPGVNGGTYYLFTSGGQGSSGAGLSVWNNAGSAANWSTTRGFRVYYGSGFSGHNDYIPALVRTTLSFAKNQDASIGWS